MERNMRVPAEERAAFERCQVRVNGSPVFPMYVRVSDPLPGPRVAIEVFVDEGVLMYELEQAEVSLPADWTLARYVKNGLERRFRTAAEMYLSYVERHRYALERDANIVYELAPIFLWRPARWHWVSVNDVVSDGQAIRAIGSAVAVGREAKRT